MVTKKFFRETFESGTLIIIMIIIIATTNAKQQQQQQEQQQPQLQQCYNINSLLVPPGGLYKPQQTLFGNSLVWESPLQSKKHRLLS